MSAMFTEGESQGGADSMEDDTPNTCRRQNGGGGVHNTHAPIVPTQNVGARHAPLRILSGISSQMQVRGFRLAQQKGT